MSTLTFPNGGKDIQTLADFRLAYPFVTGRAFSGDFIKETLRNNRKRSSEALQMLTALAASPPGGPLDPSYFTEPTDPFASEDTDDGLREWLHTDGLEVGLQSIVGCYI